MIRSNKLDRRLIYIDKSSLFFNGNKYSYNVVK
ncbi:uncharacterized protein METZ01_LOCUS48828 [marine metagenome]|uniref:Uncharacterized protein n=1 Tax=marine metagenome TaxID=408172 RepID=A0A381RXP2_9ZZZZ